jgi:hypothetical protein
MGDGVREAHPPEPRPVKDQSQTTTLTMADLSEY